MVVITLMVLVATSSMVIKDPTIAFIMNAAFSESFINFTLAGVFLLLTEYKSWQKDGDDGEEQKESTNNNSLSYYFKLLVGIFLCIFGIFHFSLSVM